MIRTFICKSEGCPGNEFSIISNEEKVIIKCSSCGEEYEIQRNENNIVTPLCGSCESEKFKVLTDNEKTYFSCVKCGSSPRVIYVDYEGNQINFKEKLLLEIQTRNLSEIHEKLEYIYIEMKDLKNEMDRLRISQEDTYELCDKIISILNKKL